MRARLLVVLVAAAIGPICAQNGLDVSFADAASAAPVLAPKTIGYAMLQKTRTISSEKVVLAESAGGHSLAQTVTATMRVGAELLEEEDEEDLPHEGAPEEAHEEHEEEHEEGDEEEHEEEHDGDHAHTAQEDVEHIAKLQRVGRLIDANDDKLLSADELHQFAKALRSKQSRDKTNSTWADADNDNDGAVSLEEIRAAEVDVYIHDPEHQAARFGASDVDGDGLLSTDEMHAFLHPEMTGGRVLQVEAAFQLARLDGDGNAALDFEEFSKMGHEDDFHNADCFEDFTLHDEDGDGRLSATEMERLLEGHDLLQHSIKKLTDSVDTDGDGHIHLDHEVPHQLDGLLDSEFVEDFFYHQHAESHFHHEL